MHRYAYVLVDEPRQVIHAPRLCIFALVRAPDCTSLCARRPGRPIPLDCYTIVTMARRYPALLDVGPACWTLPRGQVVARVARWWRAWRRPGGGGRCLVVARVASARSARGARSTPTPRQAAARGARSARSARRPIVRPIGGRRPGTRRRRPARRVGASAPGAVGGVSSARGAAPRARRPLAARGRFSRAKSHQPHLSQRPAQRRFAGLKTRVGTQDPGQTPSSAPGAIRAAMRRSCGHLPNHLRRQGRLEGSLAAPAPPPA